MRTVVSTLLVAGLILVSGAFTVNQSRGGGAATGTLQQGGDKLSGNLTMFTPGGRDYSVVGFVSGNEVKLTQPTIGTLMVNGNEMRGILDGWDNAKITLRRQ